MVDINLLPPSQKQKRLALSVLTYITIGFALLLVLLVGFTITITTVKFTITDKSNYYDNQTQILQKQLTTYKTIEQDTTLVNKDLSLVHSVLTQQLAPNALLAKIETMVGSDITLTSITIANKPAAATTAKAASPATIQLNVGGTAKTRSQIIDFKRTLEQDPSFQGVSYTITASAAALDSTVKSDPFSFTVTAGYQAVAAQTP